VNLQWKPTNETSPRQFISDLKGFLKLIDTACCDIAGFLVCFLRRVCRGWRFGDLISKNSYGAFFLEGRTL